MSNKKPIPATTRYLEADSIRITYEEVNPEWVCTVFFIHGNSGSRHAWTRQLREPSFAGFRLVAFDLPGHGDAGLPEPLATHYAVPGMAKIIAAAILTLANGKPYILAGLSLGTNIACECLPMLEARGVVLISPCIVGPAYPPDRIFKPDADLRAIFADDADHALVEQTLRSCIRGQSMDLLPVLLEDYHRVKGNFRSKLYQSVTDQQYNDEIKLLQESGLSPLLIFGATDPISDIHYLDRLEVNAYQGKIHKLNNASHFVQLDQSDLINELLLRYFTDCFTA